MRVYAIWHIILLCFFSQQYLCAGQQYDFYFRHLEVEDGLSQNMVYSILQDKQGFMWFGTQDGLNRYDGRSFRIYQRDAQNASGIGDNAIFSLLEDDEGLIWVGTSTGVYIYNPFYEHFHQFDTPTADGTSINGIVRYMQKENNGNIWIAASDEGIYCFTPEKELIKYRPDTNNKPLNIRSICCDPKGNIWMGTYQHGLYKLSATTRTFSQILLNEESHSTADNDVNDLYLLDAETLLIGTANKGVLQLNLRTLAVSPFLQQSDKGQALFVRRILQDHKGMLWLGTETGVWIYDTQTGRLSNLQHGNNDPYSLSDNAIHSMYQDREGGIWLGTYFGGVNYFIESYAQFEKYYPINGQNTISGKSISEFCEDDQGNIWIGTEDAGLNLFSPPTRTFSDGYIPAQNIHALLYENGKLWIGTFSDGLYLLDINNKQYKTYRSSLDKQTLDSDHIYSIYKDHSGTIWVGTVSGLHRYNTQNDCFERIKEGWINSQVNDITEDHRGTIWFATLGKGLYAYDTKQNSWKHYPSPVTADKERGKMVSCLLIDSRGNLWIGTEGAGFCMYNPMYDTFSEPHTVQNGLPNDVIYKLIEDDLGNIWGSTNKGLFKLDTETPGIQTYTHVNGLLGDQFNYKSGLKRSGGKMYFGGVKGFVAFYPDKLYKNEFIPPVVINNLKVYNNEVNTNSGKGSLLTGSITHTSAITLPYNASIFDIGFAALSYVSPQGNRYAYMLEGRDKEWIDAEDAHRVTYSNLPPGEYVFKVKASNSDGLWNQEPATLHIRILPPFYLTIWAYLIYLLLFMGIVYVVLSNYLKRVKRKNAQILHTLENRKEKELYQAKIEFFTNVTHEIRTPLSLIKAPLEEVMKEVNRENKHWEHLTIIQRNTNRLLKLVNELLDFRKTEVKGMNLNFVQTDIIPLINEIVIRFSPAAQIKGIILREEWQENHFIADIDGEIITKILSNLLNNALKYARSWIEVRFEAANDRMRITISNDGDKIQPEYYRKIFEPFFKLNEYAQGSGLGLPLAKSLIELHKGVIYINSKSPDTTFVVELPVHQEMAIRINQYDDSGTDKKLSDELNEIESITAQTNKPVVLLVEDNEEFRRFVFNQLKNEYNILKAANGKQALDLLDKENIDIIISDVMMPVMGGIKLCQEVKENLQYSHIPIILLTAKTTLQSEMEGLKVGADEYITKPYSIDYLKARIENLLENRKKIKESYRHSPEMTCNTIAHSKADEKFLNDLVQAIHARIEEVDLDVDTLASVMHISRATLYRKVKSISEMTPNEFIRLIRLKKSVELLREKRYKISEIAYIVGFSSSSYFAKCFYKQFGVLPKDFDKAEG